MHKIFSKPHHIKYSNIHFLAIILGALNRYHQEFAITVIDDLLESITLGLEINDFKFNQRRIAEVKYLGELYVYKMVDSAVIFDTMFKILTYGHGRCTSVCLVVNIAYNSLGGWPKPGSICPIDLPDDFFRIRLICNLLETCGTYYEKGAGKKKLDFFITFFQVRCRIRLFYVKLTNISTIFAQKNPFLWMLTLMFRMLLHLFDRN